MKDLIKKMHFTIESMVEVLFINMIYGNDVEPVIDGFVARIRELSREMRNSLAIRVVQRNIPNDLIGPPANTMEELKKEAEGMLTEEPIEDLVNAVNGYPLTIKHGDRIIRCFAPCFECGQDENGIWFSANYRYELGKGKLFNKGIFARSSRAFSKALREESLKSSIEPIKIQ